MKPEIVVMLMHNDVTGADARQVFWSAAHLPVKFWGFKNVGLSNSDMSALVDDFRTAGKTPVLEIVRFDEREALEAAALAADCRVEYFTDRLFSQAVMEKVRGDGMKYFPFCGRVDGHPVDLRGSLAEVQAAAAELCELGADGVDLIAHRSVDGDPEELADVVTNGLGGDRVIIAGSANSLPRLRRMHETGPMAFTMGGALFEGAFRRGGTFAENLETVVDELVHHDRRDAVTRYILGVDLGTTAIKAALFDDGGHELGSHAAEYTLLTPKSGYVELDADTYVKTFREAVSQVLRDCSVPGEALIALGLSAQGETFICLDANGAPVRRAIVWMDNRAPAEADEIEQHFGRTTIHATTGQVAMDAIWPASKILWLKRNEPEVFERTAKFALLKDYLVYRLTGRVVCEDSILCSTILWDIRSREYWPEMLQYLGISADQLPDIARQGEIVGAVTAAGAHDLGLPEGLPVSVGALDQACGALGIGNVTPGIFSESTGSALVSVTIVDELTLDPNARVPCFAAAIPGQYMLQPFSTGGMVMRWFRDEFCRVELQVEQLCGMDAYQLIDKEVERVPAGCDGLVVLPHLQGSGPPDLDPLAKGVILGLTLAHKKQHLARGIMEGVTMVLRRMLEATTSLGVEVTEILSLSGGSKSAVWCQIKADATKLPVHTLRTAESAACRGAAIAAGVDVGVWESPVAVARENLRFDRTFEPRPENFAVYDRLFQDYKRLQDTVKPFYQGGAQ